MSITNSREAANDNENLQNRKKADPESLTTKVYKGFVEKGIEENGVAFINRIMSLPSTDTSYQDEVMQYVNARKEFDEIGEDFRTKMSLGKIKSRLAPEYAKFKSQRNSIKSTIIKYFDVSDTDYVRNYETIINGLTLEQLRTYTGSSERLKTFFLDHSLDVPAKKNIKGFLDSLDINEKLRSLNKEKREEIEYLIYELVHETPINSPLFGSRLESMIYRLISYSVFSQQEKKELVQAFIPTISLKKVRELGLLSEAEIDNYITREYLVGVDAAHVSESLSQIKLHAESIEVPSTTLDLNTDAVLDKVVNNTSFKRLVAEIQDFHNITSSQSISDFDVLIDSITSNLAGKISGVDKFHSGSILILKGKKGSLEETQYHEIISTKGEDGSQRLVFRSRGGNGIYDMSSEDFEYLNYGEFYELLSDSKKVHAAEFISKDAFDEKISTGEISPVEGEYDFEVTNTQESFNKERLKQAIDLLDTAGGKYGLEAGTTFKTPGTLANDGDDLYTVLSLDETKLPDGEIVLVNLDGKKEKLSFKVFFNSWKSKKTKRVSKVLSGEDFLADVNSEKSIWSQTKFQGGKFINEGFPKGSQNIEYLVSDNTLSIGGDMNLIKIHSIDGLNATVSFGKYEGKVLPNASKGKKGKPANYSIDSKKSEISLGMLAAWTKEANLQGKNIGAENVEEKLPEGAKIGAGFFSNYVNNFANLASVMAAGKTWGDNMKNYFEEGTNEQAMKLASKLPVFSEEQKSAMKMRLEQSEKKHTDEALEKLKVLDSGPATVLVYKWLSDKHSTESRKVAALLYMLEKYGVLYEKKAMIQHKGTFLFYRAFGGEIGDDLYMEYKDECNRATPPKQFLEEDLMYLLIKARCRGDIKPPLRGRLYKEVEQIMGKGLTDEQEKGKKDADKKGTFAEKEQFAFGELEDGGYPNAMGAFESMVGKGNTPQRLNKLPFVMLTSGAAKSFSAQLTNKFKLGNLVLTTFFTHSSAHTDLFNRVVVSLCRDIENKLGGRYIGMGDKADKLINGMSGEPESKRIQKAKEFYESEDGLYEDILGRALLMMNTQRGDKASEFESWLRDHSDTNPDYKEYCSLVGVAFEMGADKFFGEQEELLNDAFHIADQENGGMTGLDTLAFVKKFIVPQSGGAGFRNLKMGNKVWKEITNKIDYIASGDLDEEYKRKRIGSLLTDLMDGISPTYAQNTRELNSVLTNPASVFYTKFNSWGVKDSDFALGGESFKNSKKGQEVINRYVDNILSSSDGTSNDRGNFKMKDLTSHVQSGIASNLNPSNDNQNPYDL